VENGTQPRRHGGGLGRTEIWEVDPSEVGVWKLTQWRHCCGKNGERDKSEVRVKLGEGVRGVKRLEKVDDPVSSPGKNQGNHKLMWSWGEKKGGISARGQRAGTRFGRGKN